MVAVYARGATSPYRSFAVSNRYSFYIAVGPSGTIYLASYAIDNQQQYSVLEYDCGPDRPSRVIKLPILFPYPNTEQGIAVDSSDALYVNQCGDGGGGGCGITVFPSKSIRPSGSFVVDDNTPSGALLIDRDDQIVVGDPYAHAILAKQLPATSHGYAVFRRSRPATISPSIP